MSHRGGPSPKSKSWLPASRSNTWSSRIADDHAGGARTFMAEGATLITTPGNVSYFERMTNATRTIDPDALTRNPRKPAIEAVQNKRRVLTDDNHTVELYDIGPGPHAREMLVVYLPKKRLSFRATC